LPTDDCFTKFDRAFARLEADLDPLQSDLSEFEEAFTIIDQRLDARSAASTDMDPATAAPPSAVLAAPLPSVAPEPAVETPQPTAPAAAPQPPALRSGEIEELWRRPNGGGTPLERLVVAIQNLLWLQRAIESRALPAGERVGWNDVAQVFADARQLCVDFDLPTARVRAEFALAALDIDRLDLLATEIAQLIRHMRHDLQACAIWPLARRTLWTFTTTIDDRAAQAFPSAVADVKQGGRCAGFGLYPAAVFHMLRAANCGRRALAPALRLRARDAEPVTFEGTVALLERRLAELSSWTAGPARAAAKAYFNTALTHARLLHEVERRIASDGPADEQYALAVLNTTLAFLNHIASDVAEGCAVELSRAYFTDRVLGPTPRP
jgi:hypothetical protein